MDTREEIHGHEVLEMMVQADCNFSRESLIAAIGERFGAESRFCTCSGGNMDAAELVDMLTSKGKFVGPDTAFRFDTGRRCDH